MDTSTSVRHRDVQQLDNLFDNMLNTLDGMEICHEYQQGYLFAMLYIAIEALDTDQYKRIDKIKDQLWEKQND